MRKHRGILTLIVALLLTFFVPFAGMNVRAVEYAYDSYGNKYQISDKGASLEEWNVKNTGAVTIPDSITYNGKTYTVWKINQAWNIPDNISSYSKITSVTIGKNVQEIEPNAFSPLSGLVTVSFKSGSVCKSLSMNAFASCSALTTVSLPASLTTIDNYCFSCCTNLKNIVIPDSVTSIGIAAFHQCFALTSITLPSSLKTIGERAFQQCDSLTTADMSKCASLSTLPDGIFDDCVSLSTVYLPPKVKTIGDEAFYNCNNINNITLPASVTDIGKNAFNPCAALTSVTILSATAPSNVYKRGSGDNSFNTRVKITVPTGATGYDSDSWKKYTKVQSDNLSLPTPSPSSATSTPTPRPSSATPTAKPSSATPTAKPSNGTATPTTKPSSNSPTPTKRPHRVPTNTPTPKPSSSSTGATSTPRPTSSGSGSGSSSSSSGSSSSQSQGVAEFIERLYTVALGRASDPNGKADWINRVRTQGYTGADLARGFLFSDEFLSKNMSDSAFLDVLYQTFFNRPADAQKSYWLGLISQGWTKKQVIDGFINSTEWANLCLTYGIASGTNCPPNIVIQPSTDVVAFARRLYTTCLGRNPDAGGLNNWASALANMQISGSDAARGFFFSTEFINAGHSDAEYVTRLYRTFMGREPDQGGYNNWMNALASGQTREDVFNGFANSQEWAGICAEYGILK